RVMTRWPMSFTASASSACTAIKPSAITVPSNRAIRGLSVKFGPLSLRTCCFQFTPPSLFRAPKISFGRGTTTSSTLVDNCLMLICCGAWAAPAHNASPQRTPTPNFKYLVNGLKTLLRSSPSMRILVIGDLMLDEFVWGKVGRISPEAPVPVVEVTRESFYPGGAANVARNLREFVDYVTIIGLLGNDRSGQQLQELLAEQKIDFSNAVKDESFRTIVKTRIIARHQQVVRVDREQFTGPSANQVQRVVAAVRNTVAQTDAII